MSSGGVVGFKATPASQPPARIISRVRCRWVTASGWTEMLATPASTNGRIRLSGLSTMRCASTGRSTASTSEAATTGPMVRLGTKWLSIASKWTSSAPPSLALSTSSARLAKSAASIEGAPTTLSPSSPQNAKRRALPRSGQRRIILQKKAPKKGGSRPLLHKLKHLEHRQVPGDYDAANDAADDHDHERLYDRRQRFDVSVDLGFAEVSLRARPTGRRLLRLAAFSPPWCRRRKAPRLRRRPAHPRRRWPRPTSPSSGARRSLEDTARRRTRRTPPLPLQTIHGQSPGPKGRFGGHHLPR